MVDNLEPDKSSEGQGPVVRDDDNRQLVSYRTLRRVIGILGVSLPIVVALGCLAVGECDGFLDSISAYHGTVMRNVFVGILFTVGWFLFSYRGYERKDDIAGDLGCLFALGVAIFPTTSETAWIRMVHYVSATLFFLILAGFSLFLFTKSGGIATPQKQRRNNIYLTCGVTMLVCIALIPLYNLFLDDSAIAVFHPVFWLETFALWAFGISWMTKGELISEDARRRG